LYSQSDYDDFGGVGGVGDVNVFLGDLFPIFHPQPLNVLTTFGVTAAVNGTRMKMNDLCIA